jgi:hypothetical protein
MVVIAVHADSSPLPVTLFDSCDGAWLGGEFVIIILTTELQSLARYRVALLPAAFG